MLQVKVTSICQSCSSICFRDELHSSSALWMSWSHRGIYRLRAAVSVLWALTEAWHICFTPSCTGSMFRSGFSISSEWQFTGVSKAVLPSTSWTAATRHRMLPVVSDFDLPAATISSYHDIVAARLAVGRSPSPVRWPGTCCLTTSETRRSVLTFSGRG